MATEEKRSTARLLTDVVSQASLLFQNELQLLRVEFGEKLKPVMEQVDKIKDRTDKDPAAKAWFDATYKPKMMGVMGPMMKTAQACATDKDFTAAMQALPMAGGKHH